MINIGSIYRELNFPYLPHNVFDKKLEDYLRQLEELIRNLYAGPLDSNPGGIIVEDDDGNLISKLFTPGSIIFAHTTGELWEDNPNAYFDDVNDYVGFGLGHCSGGTERPDNYIRVFDLIRFQDSIYGTQLGKQAGNAFSTGIHNTAGGYNSNLLSDGDDNTTYGYMSGGGLATPVAGGYTEYFLGIQEVVPGTQYRCVANGSIAGVGLDTTWGSSGYWGFTGDGDGTAASDAIAFMSDGRMVVGHSYVTIGANTTMVSMLNTDGSLDTTWANSGHYYNTANDDSSRISMVLVDDDDNIHVLKLSGLSSKYTYYKLNSAGVFQAGILKSASVNNINDAVWYDDNHTRIIALAGDKLMAIDVATGTIDTTWGTSGFSFDTGAAATPQSIVRASDGGFIGYFNDTNIIRKILQDGSGYDTTWGTNGIISLANNGVGYGGMKKLAIDSSDNIYFVRKYYDNPDAKCILIKADSTGTIVTTVEIVTGSYNYYQTIFVINDTDVLFGDGYTKDVERWSTDLVYQDGFDLPGTINLEVIQWIYPDESNVVVANNFDAVTAVGSQTLANITENASEATALGYLSGYTLESGSGDTFAGAYSGQYLDDADDNTLLGYKTGGGVGTNRGDVTAYPTLQELTAEEIPAAPDALSISTTTPTSISDAAGLQAISGSGHYVLTADINLSGVAWTPINNFSGVLDGGNHTISNLTISAPSTSYQGLFSNLASNAKFKDLSLSNFSIEGSSYVGALAGRGYLVTGVEIDNVSVLNSTVKGSGGYIGGMIGLIEAANAGVNKIHNCQADTVVVYGSTAGGSYYGGLLGRFSTRTAGATITTPSELYNCSCVNSEVHLYNGVVGSKDIAQIGGVCGYLYGGPDGYHMIAHSCYSDATIHLNTQTITSVGVCFGSSTFTDITSCYGNGEITTDEFEDSNSLSLYAVGGFLGANYGHCDIIDCYSTSIIDLTHPASFSSIIFIGGCIGKCDTDVCTITRCWSYGNISIGKTGVTTFCIGVGGFSGMFASNTVPPNSGLIERCFSWGTLNIEDATLDDPTDGIGGFTGYIYAYPPVIQNCYTWSIINVVNIDAGCTKIGGFLGGLSQYLNADVSITNCYAAQPVKPISSSETVEVTTTAPSGTQLPQSGLNVGGFMGGNDSVGLELVITESFFDSTTSGYTEEPDSDAVPHTTEWLKINSNFSNADWDLSTIWYMPDPSSNNFDKVTAVGSESLANIITGADTSTAIGYHSGYNLSTGNGLFVGSYAGKNQTTVADIFLLDHGRDRGSAANELTKSLMYGTFDDDPENQTLVINADVTAPSLTLTDLTANRLVATDGTKLLVSSDLTSWIDGTENQIIVNDDGDGTITLSLPQDIDTAADVVFGTVTLLGQGGFEDSITYLNASGTISFDANLAWDGSTLNITGDISAVGDVYAKELYIIDDVIAGIWAVSNATTQVVLQQSNDDGATSPFVYFRKSRGVRTAPTTVVDDDYIGLFRFTAHDGSNFLSAAEVRAEMNGTIASTRVPADLVFSTATDDAPSVLTEGLRITSAQVAVGKIFNATNTSNMVQANGTTILRIGEPTYYNVFLGESTFNTHQGTNNVGIGYQAGYNNNITGGGNAGFFNVYIGGQAGYGATLATDNTGKYNVALGYQALYSNTTGEQNFALGFQALKNQTTGSGGYNVAIGYQAMLANLTGAANIAIGTLALGANLSGLNNMAIGRSAMFSNTTGGYNTVVGREGLYWNTTGERNICLGYQAGGYNAGSIQVLNKNVFIGDRVAQGCLTGADYNVLIGYLAGNKLTTGTMNTATGLDAGYNVTTGSRNVFYGAYAGFRQTTGSDLFIIDNQDRSSAANELTRALLYGTFDATAANQWLRINGEILGSDGAKLGDGGTTNYTTIAADGYQTMAGDARVKHELLLPLTDFNPGASGPTPALHGIFPTEEYTINDDSHTSFEVPDDWDSSTDIEISVYWAIDEAYATNSGEVQWQAAWAACPVGEVITAPTHTGTIDFGDVNIPATANTLVKTSGSIAAASLAAGDTVALNLARVALDAGSNPTAEPYVVRVELEWTANMLGGHL